MLPSFCLGEAHGNHHGHSKEESSQHQQLGHKATKILQEVKGLLGQGTERVIS